MRLRTMPLVAAMLLGGATAVPAQMAQVSQERVDLSVVERIREEGTARSQIEQLARHMNDVIGPRLTGSTGMKNANEWTAQKFREWGLQNVAIEPWGEFGRGWERVSYAGRITAPFAQPLVAQPLAWSGSTRGTAEGPVIAVRAITPEDLIRDYSGKLKGAWIMATEHTPILPEFDPITRRMTADQVLPPPPAPRPQTAPAGPQQGRPPQQTNQGPTMTAVLDSMAKAEGALGFLRPSQWAYGILRVGGVSRTDMNPLPALVISHDHYGQLWRNATNGVPARVEINVQNRFLDTDRQQYNSLGEIPGTDRRDEYVMIGAHLDSWHTGTGATDNSAGSVIMMEAMRILKALNLPMKRTVRIGLWSGEEQGLLGSRGYVAKHPELHSKISAYLNIDNGGGKLRGIWNQSNPQVTPMFEQLLWPFRGDGVVGVRTGNTGSTDHVAFDAAGIPGFNFIQDPLEYSLRTHHSSADTFDRLIMDDLRQAAIIVASTAYHLANREEMVPRKPRPAS